MWNKIEVLRCGMDLKIKKWDTNICSPDRFIIKVSVISWQGHFYYTYRYKEGPLLLYLRV